MYTVTLKDKSCRTSTDRTCRMGELTSGAIGMVSLLAVNSSLRMQHLFATPQT